MFRFHYKVVTEEGGGGDGLFHPEQQPAPSYRESLRQLSRKVEQEPGSLPKEHRGEAGGSLLSSVVNSLPSLPGLPSLPSLPSLAGLQGVSSKPSFPATEASKGPVARVRSQVAVAPDYPPPQHFLRLDNYPVPVPGDYPIGTSHLHRSSKTLRLSF